MCQSYHYVNKYLFIKKISFEMIVVKISKIKMPIIILTLITLVINVDIIFDIKSL